MGLKTGVGEFLTGKGGRENRTEAAIVGRSVSPKFLYVEDFPRVLSASPMVSRKNAWCGSQPTDFTSQRASESMKAA